MLQSVTTVEALRALRPEWDALHASASDGNPFTQWLWVWHWWQSFGRSQMFRHHRLQVSVFRDGAGRVRAIAPFVLTSWGRPPLAVRTLRLYGFGEAMTELRAPLVCPGWEARAGAAILETLRAHFRMYDWCVLDGLAAGGPLHAEVAVRLGDAWGPAIPDYVLPLPETWELLRAGLSRRMKDNINYYYNLLRRDGHTWRFESVAEPDALPEALDDFFRLHAARSAMSDAPHHANQYRTEASRRFLRGLAHDLAAGGRLRLCRLRLNGAVAACMIVLVTEAGLYFSFSGFDPAWRRYSVMTLLTVECIKQAIAEGRRSVNLSSWPTHNKLRWVPQEVVFHSVRMLAPTRRAHLMASLHRHGLAARNRWHR